jgi:hypothetical protein
MVRVMAKASSRVVARDSVEIRSPLQIARDAADAMYRAACECCHQHDRMSRIQTRSPIETEVEAAEAACCQCHEVLATMSSSYQQVAAELRPPGKDEDWWHRANALWLASREYLRRNGSCDESSKQLKEHGPDRLDALHMEYELEASALLALKHAAEAYRQNRPTAA